MSFHIDVLDDPDYEDLVAEIYLNDAFLGTLSQERGFESLDFEIQPPPSGQPWRIPLAELLAAVAAAKNRLWELRRESNPPHAPEKTGN